MQLRVLTTVDSVPEGAWNRLLALHPQPTPFLTKAWFSKVSAVFAPNNTRLLIVETESQEMVAVMPLIQDSHDTHLWRSLSDQQVTDYWDALIDPPYAPTFFACLKDWIKAQQNTIICEAVTENSQLRSLYTSHESLRKNIQEQPEEVCPVIHLPPNWEDYLAMIGRKQRHELRRKERIFQEAGGRISYHSQLNTELLTTFHNLHQASSAAKATYWNTMTNHFFSQLFLDKSAELGLQLALAHINNQPIAAILYLDSPHSSYLYNSGYDPAFATTQAGVVLITDHIRRSILERKTTYDFLRGNETYKYRFGALDTKIYQIVLS